MGQYGGAGLDLQALQEYQEGWGRGDMGNCLMCQDFKKGERGIRNCKKNLLLKIHNVIDIEIKTFTFPVLILWSIN